ncbi:MAG: ferric reductase-like transmembrane domain-containing protein [Gammaproteobacteria bacterium]|nr:ferric reductase-like transmembrane domain-containing protein [Gammaproteobacteria bacterium]
MAAPALPLLADFWLQERYYSELMYESGVLSVQLLILCMCITPLRFLTQSIRWLKPVNRWLLRNRRYFGVACFGYGFIHLMVYLRQYPDIADILNQAIRPELATGWIAMFALTALALTSNDRSIRHLGHRWRTLHRLVYPIAALLYLHWYLIGFFLQVLNFWYTPLVLFLIYRIVRRTSRHKQNQRCNPPTVQHSH